MHMTTSRDGTRIAYDRLGSGPAVVLVGGGPTTRMVNAELAALLAEDFTVVNYDRRGRGDSADTRPYAVEREHEDLAAMIGVAGGAVSVVGSSGGAVLALHAAAAGLPIARLALWEPSYVVAGTPPFPARDYRQQLELLIGQGRPGDALALFFTDAVGLPAAMVEQMRPAPFWTGTEQIAHTLVYDAAVAGDFSVPTERLATVSVPTVVLDGATTPWLTAAAEAVAPALPQVRRRTLSGQQHAVDPAVLAPAVVAALCGADTSGSVRRWPASASSSSSPSTGWSRHPGTAARTPTASPTEAGPSPTSPATRRAWPR